MFASLLDQVVDDTMRAFARELGENPGKTADTTAHATRGEALEGLSRHCEQRLIDAVWTLRRLPDREAGFLYCRQALWPDMPPGDNALVTPREQFSHMLARKKVRPDPRQIDNMQPALDLLRVLPDIVDRRILFWGAWHQDGEVQSRIPWAKVRHSLGVDLSRWTLKRRYTGGFHWIAEIILQRAA